MFLAKCWFFAKVQTANTELERGALICETLLMLLKEELEEQGEERIS